MEVEDYDFEDAEAEADPEAERQNQQIVLDRQRKLYSKSILVRGFTNPLWAYLDNGNVGGIIRCPVAAIHGPFKIGKTLITGRVTGNSNLTGDATEPTLGLCLALAADPPRVSPARPAAPAARAIAISPAATGGKKALPAAVMGNARPIRPATPVYSIAILDAAGSGEPEPQDRQAEALAEQFFLTEIKLRMTRTHVLVTRRFDYPFQVELNNFLNLMSASGSPATEDHRLIVVINAFDICEWKAFETLYNSVANSFTSVLPLESQPTKRFGPDNGRQEAYRYLLVDNPFLTFVFLVNDKAGLPGCDFDNQGFNQVGFDLLRSKMAENNKIVEFDLGARFLQHANNLLFKYFDNYKNDELFYDAKGYQEPVFRMRRPVPDKWNEYQELPEDWVFKISSMYQSPFGILSCTNIVLQADWAYLPTKRGRFLEVVIAAPGFLPEAAEARANLQLRFEPDGRRFMVTVQLPSVEFSDGLKHLCRNISRGQGSCTIDLPEELRLNYPEGEVLKAFYKEISAGIKHGLIRFKINLRDSSADSDDEDETAL